MTAKPAKPRAAKPATSRAASPRAKSKPTKPPPASSATPRAKPSPAASDALWRRLVGYVLTAHDDARRAIRDATGLPGGRVRVLRRLADGPRTLRELAALTGTDAPSTTVTVNDLEARGLVLREVSPDNRREKLVSLTAAGRATLARAQREIETSPPAFAAIARDDLDALARILDALAP